MVTRHQVGALTEEEEAKGAGRSPDNSRKQPKDEGGWSGSSI